MISHVISHVIPDRGDIPWAFNLGEVSEAPRDRVIECPPVDAQVVDGSALVHKLSPMTQVTEMC